ncbi:uncharacterized protein LOC113508250 [Trichoplusia ni]|uniref:Uncharacterized protein LOC113508250 n=1 Tax=Trichoplusia ni TaxID=7111 RepID=A0A7E5X3J9_TRINI|nr:uncharacterized protein LOC113508250 [Trichoplusia ni]
MCSEGDVGTEKRSNQNYLRVGDRANRALRSERWAPAAEKLMVRNQLDSLQRGFVQKICKAYRTVSLTSALLLSGQLLLDLRVAEAATLFRVKKGYSDEFLPPGREVERKAEYLQHPHPSKLVLTEYQQLEDFNSETVETHQVVGPHIYTDGSKIEGKVGAALTWWDGGKEVKQRTFRLEPHNTVFQSELYDSRSSLDLLRCPRATHQLAHNIKEMVRGIREEGRNVKLFWLRAHVGILGNERADELAKKAALTKKTAPDYNKVPISFVKKSIREETVKRWQESPPARDR